MNKFEKFAAAQGGADEVGFAPGVGGGATGGHITLLIAIGIAVAVVPS
jgi:hypothetical protein